MTSDATQREDGDAPEDGATADTSSSPQASPAPTAEKPGEPAERGRRSSPAVIVFALSLAFFAAAAAGFLWWQYRQFYVALDRADGDTNAALRDVRANLRALDDRLAELAQERADLTRVVEQVVDRMNSFPARFADIDERIAAAQGISANARGRWLRAQAEYYLGVANAEIALRGNQGNAIAALELADQALLDAGSPAFGPVRDRIAGELLDLRGMSAPDVEGLSYSLSRLGERVPDLPMRRPSAERRSAGAADRSAEPGLGRLWRRIQDALAGMFRVERHTDDAVYSVSRADQALISQQVELELTLARLGLVQALPELFTSSLARARALIQRHFDTEDAAIEGALALLEDMATIDVAPPYPDISGSLALLRDVPERDR